MHQKLPVSPRVQCSVSQVYRWLKLLAYAVTICSSGPLVPHQTSRHKVPGSDFPHAADEEAMKWSICPKPHGLWGRS